MPTGIDDHDTRWLIESGDVILIVLFCRLYSVCFAWREKLGALNMSPFPSRKCVLTRPESRRRPSVKLPQSWSTRKFVPWRGSAEVSPAGMAVRRGTPICNLVPRLHDGDGATWDKSQGSTLLAKYDPQIS